MTPDYDSDERDGALFRFWIRAVEDGHAGKLANALTHCRTPADYRKAITELANELRINLP